MKSLISLLCLVLTACASVPSLEERRMQADALAARHGWHAEKVQAGAFDLLAYVPAALEKTATLSIYIEGDGLAWNSGSQPSTDPTPRNPLALRLALAQPNGQAVYLGRPCQYINAEASACPSRYWTNGRFAPEVVAATNAAVEHLKSRAGAHRLNLIGFSGGGAIAALVASRRHDVERLITVAGNLDHRAWTAHHHLRPLAESLDSVDAIGGLQAIEQWHWVGGKDTIIPTVLVHGFANQFPSGVRPRVLVEPDFDHHCCWAEAWGRLWETITR